MLWLKHALKRTLAQARRAGPPLSLSGGGWRQREAAHDALPRGGRGGRGCGTLTGATWIGSREGSGVAVRGRRRQTAAADKRPLDGREGCYRGRRRRMEGGLPPQTGMRGDREGASQCGGTRSRYRGAPAALPRGSVRGRQGGDGRRAAGADEPTGRPAGSGTVNRAAARRGCHCHTTAALRTRWREGGGGVAADGGR